VTIVRTYSYYHSPVTTSLIQLISLVLAGLALIMVVYLEARASRREGRSDQLDSRLKG